MVKLLWNLVRLRQRVELLLDLLVLVLLLLFEVKELRKIGWRRHFQLLEFVLPLSQHGIP